MEYIYIYVIYVYLKLFRINLFLLYTSLLIIVDDFIFNC